MKDKTWIPVKTNLKEGTRSIKKVTRSGIKLLVGKPLLQAKRTSTAVTYELSGAWRGKFDFNAKVYDMLAVPGGGVFNREGYPEIPQEGIFVALPNGAGNIQVKTLEKEVYSLPGKFTLRPAPKPIIEEEYLAGKGEYKPNAEVYKSDKAFLGKDFEFLGLKHVDGILVAHIMLYLAQYVPKKEEISLLKKITLEVSYDVPAQDKPVPEMKSLTSALNDLVMDIENIGEISAINLRLNEMPHPTLHMPDIGTHFELPSVYVLKKAGIICEYLIITSQALKDAVTPLLNAKTGWPYYARVATTETIKAEFPAVDLKESVRAMLIWAWAHWKVPPRFVVLAGDVDTIPVHVWTVGGSQYASDHYYADIRNDLSPEIVVSRIPTSNAATMRDICENLAQYSNRRGPDWGNWKNEVALVAFQADVYKNCSDEISDMIDSRFRVTKLYGDSSTRADVVKNMNDGVLIANYRGHGSKTEWSSANGLRTSDIRTLTNDNIPPMVFSICCQNGWIDAQNTEAVAETFLREGKCVAIFAATRNSPTYANNDFDKYLWEAIMDWGETTPGNIVNRAKALMVMNHSSSVSHQQDVVMYMLFGDPTARVASNVEFLRGEWDMDHDGWKGVLYISRIWQSRVEKIGDCGYPVWSISGKYTNQNGDQYDFSGRIGGKDSNNLNAGCKRTDYKLIFYIEFPGNKQKFEGYVMTRTRNAMAGYTWWANTPFGWYAKKR